MQIQGRPAYNCVLRSVVVPKFITTLMLSAYSAFIRSIRFCPTLIFEQGFFKMNLCLTESKAALKSIQAIRPFNFLDLAISRDQQMALMDVVGFYIGQ